MRFSEELDLAEIAAITKIPVNTVKTHLHRALKSVRSPGSSSAVRSPAHHARHRCAIPNQRPGLAARNPLQHLHPIPAGETL